MATVVRPPGLAWVNPTGKLEECATTFKGTAGSSREIEVYGHSMFEDFEM